MASAPPSVLATRRGKLTLALLCAVAFLDFVDASIVNVALPSIRHDLRFSVQNLQWVLGGYLLTYGGFMLLGGRAADLLGRRRILVAGTSLFAVASMAGGFAGSSGVLVGARLVQGLGAAMMLPAALSTLTTTFKEGSDRHTALGVWGGVGGLASAAGVLLGGLLTQGPGWRWVLFVNPPICLLVLAATFYLISDERRTGPLVNFDAVGAILGTSGMLLLIYALVKAPDVGWGTARTIGEVAAALGLVAAFVINEWRARNPLVPLSIFRLKGLGAADATQLIAFAGFLAMFFFLTLYMQNVLGYSPIHTGLAYLPVCVTVGIAAGVSSTVLTRTGTRPVMVAGALIAAVGLYWLSRIPVDGSYASDVLPGMVIMSIGLGAGFVATATAANAGVPPDKAGLAAALLNASQQLGGALGLAILSAVATSRTHHLLATHDSAVHALNAGLQRALLVAAIFALAAAVIALRATNTRGQPPEAAEPSSPMEPAPPTFGTPVLGQAEKALNAILGRQLARTGLTEPQWVTLAMTAAGGGAVDADQLVREVAGVLQVSEAEALAGIDELAAAELLRAPDRDGSPVMLTDAGGRLHDEIRGAVAQVTQRLWGDLPDEDLATAGRVLSTVLARANTELAAA